MSYKVRGNFEANFETILSKLFEPCFRAPAYTGSSLRSSLQESSNPLAASRERASSFAYENILTSELNSDHADIERRVSDRSRSSTASKRRSLLDALLGSSVTSLQRSKSFENFILGRFESEN